MKKLLLALSLIGFVGAPAFGQHIHSVPHSSTHFHTYQHSNHGHTVPHTTTHVDQVWHNGLGYVPHASTHYDTHLHSNHTHAVPHTTTHLDPVYPSTYGSGVIYPSPSPLMVPSVVTPNVGGVVTAPPPATISSSYSASKPVVDASVASNVIPGKSSLPAGARRTIVIANPSDSGGDIRYSVNGFPFTITPGQAQTLNLDREWTIKFDNGLGRQISYRLTEGKYNFSVSEDKGWDVGRVVEETAVPAPPGPVSEIASSNAIPKK